MSPATALLLARFRLLAALRPDLVQADPWYAVEGRRIRELARAVGVDPERAIMAAATLSPAVRWEDLVLRLPDFLRAFVQAARAGRQDDVEPPRFPGYRRNVVKAWRILGGLQAKPRGPKVSRFARNLAGDDSPVTVDRWAARAAGLPESGGRAWYRDLERAYLDAAAVLGMAPSRVQAVLWVAVRDRLVPWGQLETDRGIPFRGFQGSLFGSDGGPAQDG